ncbi:MAG TPA: formate/nitrite transporter family protein [Gammaproteobacteria bacterium]|nr:formate/nitrite transporter family protein [Gammaproteobacteria bacterium]
MSQKSSPEKIPGESEVEAEAQYLEQHERREAARRTAPRAAIVYEAVRREGEQELARPIAALAWSGLAAGLSMGFSFLSQSLLASWLPQAHWSIVVSGLGYSVGFLMVILGRQQLFTENTLTPILVFLRKPDAVTAGRTLRLWVVVLIANTLGAFLFALLIAKTNLLVPQVHAAMNEVSSQVFAAFPLTLLRGIFAGWLIAMIIWLLPFAETARVGIIILITYVIALGHFAHIIAGSVDAFYAALSGNVPWGAFFTEFYVPTVLGNIIGGVSLVAAINYAQVETLEQRNSD